MTQGVLPFKYEEEKDSSGMTALAGLPLYLDLAQVAGLSKSIRKHLHVRQDSQGWTDPQMVVALILLNLAGGDCVDDLKVLEGDEGFCRVFRKSEYHGLTRKVRRDLERRWRKERRRSVPSPSSVFRYLEKFHDPDQEKLRKEGKALIPAPNEALRAFAKINADFFSFVQSHNDEKTATLDMDATLVETHKKAALHCYKGFKSYQPLNTWWAEHEMIVHTEFRDGNVPAGYEQLRVFKDVLCLLPESVKKVRLRSDTAGYQHNLLRYCEMGKNERFGKIEFAIGCDVTAEFKKAVAEVRESDWKTMSKTVRGKKREWAEVCFVPSAIGNSKKGPEYRYMATREKLEQMELPGMEQPQLPFPTLKMKTQSYKVFGVVTNMDWPGEALIHWSYKRCGKSEQAHDVMKNELAGGCLPSGDFGQNAAWWWIMILALNLNAMMKKLVLGKSFAPKRLKALRFALIQLPGRVIERSRQLIIRIAKGHPSFDQLIDARRRIVMLKQVPAG